MKKWKKVVFNNLRQLSNFTNFITTFHCATPCEGWWIYLALILTFLKVKRAGSSVAQNSFWLATFQKFVVLWDHTWKTAEASRNCFIISSNQKKKKKWKNYMYNKGCLSKKTLKVRLLLVFAFISLLLLVMLFKIVFLSHHHINYNRSLHLLPCKKGKKLITWQILIKF